MARLGDYVRIRTGKLDANASSENGQYPFFTCAVEPLRIDSYSYDCECVLVAGNGDLNVKYYNGKFDAYQRTYIIESLDKMILSVPYLFCFLDKYVEKLRTLSIGGVIKYIKLGNLTEANIPLPKIQEQYTIVELCYKVNTLLSLRKQQLAKLDELVKTRFVEMFGDPVTNSMGWKTKAIKELASKIGSGATPKGGRESYGTEGISLIRSMNVYNGRFEYRDLAHITDEQADKLDNVSIEKDDVLLNITGASVARCCVVPEDVIPARVNQHVCIIRCKDCISPEFMCNVLTDGNYQKHLWRIAGSGATREAITKQQVETLPIIIPPNEFQQQFSDFCRQVNKSKLAVQQSIDQLETLKKSLMQKYFG